MTPNNKIPKKKLDEYRTFLDINIPTSHGVLTGITRDCRLSFVGFVLRIITGLTIGIVLLMIVFNYIDKPNEKDLLQEQRDRIHSEIYK